MTECREKRGRDDCEEVFGGRTRLSSRLKVDILPERRWRGAYMMVQPPCSGFWGLAMTRQPPCSGLLGLAMMTQPPCSGLLGLAMTLQPPCWGVEGLAEKGMLIFFWWLIERS